MTAAPGPQQPDEVRWACCDAPRPGRHPLGCPAHDAVSAWDDKGDGHTAAEIAAWEAGWAAAAEVFNRPAAPSAQPDEGACGQEPLCTVRTPHHTHVDVDGRAWCCQRNPYTPAQPVRDTKEGRRLCAGGVVRDMCCGLPGACDDC